MKTTTTTVTTTTVTTTTIIRKQAEIPKMPVAKKQNKNKNKTLKKYTQTHIQKKNNQEGTRVYVSLKWEFI